MATPVSVAKSKKTAVPPRVKSAPPKALVIPRVDVSIDTRQGARDHMEDVADCVTLPDGRIFVIVCDGHGGRHAAQFALARITQSVLQFKPDQSDLAGVIKAASDAWDVQCLSKLGAVRYPQSDAERKAVFRAAPSEYADNEWHSGTTVVCVLLDLGTKTGVIANLGDSRCVWKDFTAKGRTRVTSTRDHEPKSTDFGPLGGTIVHAEDDVPRINGDLAVGRAFGDNSAELMGSVNHTPKISRCMWTDHLRVILGSDGVWDVVKNCQAMQRSKRTGECVVRNAGELVDLAMQRGTQDNVTAVVVDVTYPTQVQPAMIACQRYSATT